MFRKMAAKSTFPLAGKRIRKSRLKPYNLFEDRPLEIGAGRQIGGNQGNDTFLDALIDEIIIWDRALSEDEVQDLANGNRPDRALAVKAEGKLTTAWGKMKSYHRR